MSKTANKHKHWTGSIEALEVREVMSADPLGGLLVHHDLDVEPTDVGFVHHDTIEDAPPLEHQVDTLPDFWVDPSDELLFEEDVQRIEQTLYSAHQTTGLNQVIADYGFSGIGQTVAVIDSGIAYDHFALGGGLGANYRVVGGWDFTENDADPYDDGPAGSHGTHVAGIIGGDSGNDHGVATGVDLVGLRVFDDSGAGYFSWVESALQWVHTNRNNFENPITAINLSLGVSGWNADAVPSWSSLEDEFAQLEADGIFIAVSAGNSFADYNSPGLSYPASSPYVVPVMAVTDAGNLAGYSQRLTRAIAAPGSSIRSTVPDYNGNNNNIADDYGYKSGTSMAAPYIAGSSVLIRQAMDFAGYANITEDMIYDQMMSTGTQFFDSATSQTYTRINLEAAIDSLMPVDDFGSTLGTAFDLGTLSGPTSQSGVISTLNDIDYFQFTASSNGTVTFDATTTTHELTADWSVSGSTGSVSGANGETFSFDVVANQTYTVGIATSQGLGYYTIDISSQAAFSYVDWGVVSYDQKTGLSVAGESWYSVQASQAGYLTVESMFDTQSGAINLQLYNANLQMVDSGTASNGMSRVDAYVSQGEEYFVCVQGTNSDVDYRLSNLVSVSGMTVNVAGTSGADLFAFTAGSTHQVMVNGVTHDFASTSVDAFSFNGGAGTDSITMTGTSGDDTATLSVGTASLTGTGFVANTVSTENVAVYGGGGVDEVTLYDSAGDDRLTSQGQHVTFELAGGDILEAIDFGKSRAYASGGTDSAELLDTAGDEVVAAWSTRVYMTGADYLNDTRNFDQTVARSVSGGSDRVAFYDTAGDDVFAAWSNRAYMVGDGYYNDTRGFSRTTALATSGGSDRVAFYDTAGDDVYAAWSTRAYMIGDGYYNDTRGFGRSTALATSGGYDRAALYDTAGNDVYVTWPDRAVLYGTGFYNDARGFERTTALATSGGYDQAVFNDSPGDDVYVAWSNKAVIYGLNYYHDARGFDQTTASATAGGNDKAVFFDSAGNDVYTAWSNRALMSGTGYFNDTYGFQTTTAHATAGGYDRAVLYDSVGDDQVVAAAWGAYVAGSAFHNEGRDFDDVTVYLDNGGNDETDIETVDYAFQLLGQFS